MGESSRLVWRELERSSGSSTPRPQERSWRVSDKSFSALLLLLLLCLVCGRVVDVEARNNRKRWPSSLAQVFLATAVSHMWATPAQLCVPEAGTMFPSARPTAPGPISRDASSTTLALRSRRRTFAQGCQATAPSTCQAVSAHLSALLALT